MLNAVIDPAALRESDLLAFELAIETGHPGSVMCAYNRINGPYACGNAALLNDVLKGDWHYPGWVMSDWGAVPGADAAVNGLDQESGEQLDGQIFFDGPLHQAIADGTVPPAHIADMARRILRSMFAVGLFDAKRPDGPIDEAGHAETARRIAEQGIVLLRNEAALLSAAQAGQAHRRDRRPCRYRRAVRRRLVPGPAGRRPRGSHSVGGEDDLSLASTIVYQPASPLKAIRDKAGAAEVRYLDGRYVSRAVRRRALPISSSCSRRNGRGRAWTCPISACPAARTH
ncbi:MAG: glycoside hydrolase family 3 N-terminal domain-containing protein [Aliidongia sp.]